MMLYEDVIAMEALERKVEEFYATQDKTRRDAIHKDLLETQSRSDAWEIGLQLLVPTTTSPVRHFGAGCLYEGLSKSWEECTNVENRFETIRKKVVEYLQHEPPSSTFVRNKLSSVLAVLILQSVPDIWSDPVTELCGEWGSGHPITLLRVLALIPVERKTVRVPLDRRNVVLTVLSQNTELVRNTIASILSQAGDDKLGSHIVNASIECVEAWMGMPNSKVNDWQEISLLCLQKVHLKECRESVSRFLGSLAENDELMTSAWKTHSGSLFLAQLFHFAANVLGPLLRKTAEEFGLEDEDVEGMIRAIVLLCESHTSFVVTSLLHGKDPELMSSLQRVTEILLFTSGAPGRYPLEERVSDLPSNFWYLLQEEATTANTNRNEAELAQSRSVLGPLYAELLKGVLPKLVHPAETELSKEESDSLLTYRNTMGDVVLSCYRVLVDDALKFLLEEFRGSPSAAQELEGRLFAFKALAEYVPAENAHAIAIIRDIIPALPLDQSVRLANTALGCLDSLSHTIITSDAKEILYPASVTLISGFLSHPNSADIASVALKRLVEERDPSLVGISADTMERCYRCFQDSTLNERTRLRALECLGYVLSLLPNQTVIETLEKLLIPRLKHLNDVCNSSQTMGKDQLLFELDIVSTLVGTLQNPSTESEGVPPVYLVLEGSLPLFQSLLSASGMDRDVVRRLCDCTRRGVGALLDRSLPLVPSLSLLLDPVFPPNICIFGPFRQLFLLFHTEPNIAPLFADLLNGWAERTLPLCDSDHNDTVEGLMGFVYQVGRKQWDLLEVTAGLPTLVLIAVGVLEKVREAPAVKQASFFLCELLKHRDSVRASSCLQPQTRNLAKVSVERIRVEVLQSSVEYVADVLLGLTERFPLETREMVLGEFASGTSPVINTLLNGMFGEVKNKRKFREFAKRINMESKRTLKG